MTRLSAVGGVFAILLVLFGAARATAQIPQEMNGLPIVEIRVRGEASAIVDPSELGIRKGVPLRRQLLRRATQELLSSGQWGNVQFDATPVPGGVRLTVTLTPRATILRIDLRGNEQLSDDEVVRAAEIAQGAVLADLDLDGVPSRLGDAYRNVGYYDVEVKVLVRDTDDPTRKVVVFEISEGEPTRIRGISFEGESPPPASGFLDGAGISTGQVLHRRRLDERLRAGARYARERGYFETNISSPRIRIRDGGAEIRISAYFGPRYDLEMRGYAPLAESEVASELELSNEPLSDGAMAGFEERVADLYRRHGYWKATARAFSLPPNRKGRAKLRIDIIPGTQARVLSVAFPGARHLSQEDLREQVFSYLEQDLPGSTYLHPVDPEVANVGGAGAKERWRRDAKRPVLMDPRTTYYEATYNEAVASVLERYQAEGFLRAEVGPHRVRVLNDKELLVEIPVFEGPRAFLRSLSIKGTKSIARGTLLEATELRQGAPFSHLALEQARIRMADLYREEGFLYVRVEAQVSLSEDGTLAAVAFEIVEGFQVHVGEVIIRGAKDTKESLIRDTLALSPGDLYRPSRATRSQEKLLDLGVFSGVNIAPLDAELPARVKPIVVTVTELKPQLLEPRAGFSTGEGLRGGFEYRYRNLFGYAISVSLYTNLAYQFIFIDDEIERRFESLSTLDRLERNVTLGFGFPRVPLLPDTRATISGGLLRDNERDFGLEKVGGTISLAWRPTRRLTFTVAEDLEQNVVDLFVTNSLNDYLLNNTDPRLERLLRVPEGESVILATRASAALDLRDNPFNTRRGAYLAVNGEFARTLDSNSGDAAVASAFVSRFIKVGATASGYVPLGKMVFAAQVRIGRIFHLTDDSKTYPNRAFYLGGVDTIRGYLQDALIPQDVAERVIGDLALSPNQVARAADAFALLRAELRFPIVGNLQGGVFTDVGNAWADPTRLLEDFTLRPTAGAGLRYATPVGPLAIDYGILLHRRRALDEGFGAFHFSIGLF